MPSSVTTTTFDLKNAVSTNRLIGLWRMMTGFRLTYLGATLSMGVAAVSKTATFLLLRYFVDDVLGQEKLSGTLPLIALGFVGLALIEGAFTFLSGRLAAQTAEGIVLRLRNYLFDHIQRLSFAYHDRTQTGKLIQRSTSDVEALRRFFADQSIGVGRIILLFAINLTALLELNRQLALLSIAVVPLIVVMSLFFFRKVSKAYEAYQEHAREEMHPPLLKDHDGQEHECEGRRADVDRAQQREVRGKHAAPVMHAFQGIAEQVRDEQCEQPRRRERMVGGRCVRDCDGARGAVGQLPRRQDLHAAQ